MMKFVSLCLVLILIILGISCEPGQESGLTTSDEKQQGEVTMPTVDLPEPQFDSDVSLEQTLLERRSTRSYTGEPLTLKEISQLLWAAQGITNPQGHRTAPSAGGLYPLELYVVAGNVSDLEPGLYRYLPKQHGLALLAEGDIRADLTEVALSQTSVKEGAVSIVVTAIYERTTGKYGDRGIRYVHMEAGHAAQNLCLQATALRLGLVTVGAYHEDDLIDLIQLSDGEVPLYIIPVGWKE